MQITNLTRSFTALSVLALVACVDADLTPPTETVPTEPRKGDIVQGACSVEPVCSAFHTGGKGEVAVSIDPAKKTALVKSNGLANHAMGPYGKSPYKEAEQKYNFPIPLAPKPVTGGGTDAKAGPIGVAFNGIPLFGPSEPQALSGCTGNSGVLSGDRTDPFGGSVTPKGEYHYYAGQFLKSAAALGVTHSTAKHSSILGYAFDGFPIYGPYGFKKRDDAGSGIKLLRSCYALKSARTCCTDPSVCGTAAAYHGQTLTLGSFLEDYEFSQASHDTGACDLNEFNMRLQKTPEYPEGVWAYIMTVDEGGEIQFPYAIGLKYYGAVAPRPKP